MKGDRYRNVAFLEVNIFLSAILSDKRFFDGVSEHKALRNQPVEVRVDPRVSGSPKVKSPGEVKGLV